MVYSKGACAWFIITLRFSICAAQLSPELTRLIKDQVSGHIQSKSPDYEDDDPDEIDGGLGDLLKNVNDFGRKSGKLTVDGRDITYRTKGRIHSIDELWVYDCVATDVKTSTQVEARHFKKKREAMEAAVQKLFDELKSRGLLEGDDEKGEGGKSEPGTDDTGDTSQTGDDPVKDKEKDGTMRLVLGVCISIVIILLTALVPCTISKKSRNSKNVEFKTRSKGKREDGIIDICPDVDGYYTHLVVEPAKPTTSQLDPEENYVMHTTPRKGIVFIMNNDCFFKRSGTQRQRKGSEVDLANVKYVFEQIGYETVVNRNLPADGIRIVLDSLVSRINVEGASKHMSLVVVLMSHGQQGGILGTDEKIVTLDEIMIKFSGRRCPALLEKPKIMFIQACRGEKVTKSAMDTDNKHPPLSDTVRADSDTPFAGKSAANSQVETDGPGPELPDNADMFTAFATSDGYFSLRSCQNGSWFIQALCEELIANAHVDDLDTMMNRVTRRVTSFIAFVPNEKGGSTKMLQTPHISKQGIRKKIHFLPKYPPTIDSD